MTDQGRKIGTRGFMTKQVLDYNGYPQAVMVGDPAWYHLPSLGKEFVPPKHLHTIVFTPPANKHYFKQAKSILAYIVKEFGNCPSTSKIVVSFHRGIDDDFAHFAESQHCKVVDVSGNISHLQFYDSCGLHVGHSLHAHLHFLSLRKPSYVIADDFRVLESLNTLASFGFSGWYVDRIHSESGTQQWNAYLTPSLPKILVEQIVNDKYTHFSRFAGLGTIMDSFYRSSMKPFLEQLP